jgi:hypothetical protein
MRKAVGFLFVVVMLIVSVGRSAAADDNNGIGGNSDSNMAATNSLEEDAYIRQFLTPLENKALDFGSLGGFTRTDSNGRPIMSFDFDSRQLTYYDEKGQVSEIYYVPKGLAEDGAPLLQRARIEMPNGWSYFYLPFINDKGEIYAERYIINNEKGEYLGAITIKTKAQVDAMTTKGIDLAPFIEPNQMVEIAEKIFGGVQGISNEQHPLVYLDKDMRVITGKAYENYSYRASIAGMNLLVEFRSEENFHHGNVNATAEYFQNMFGSLDSMFDVVDVNKDGKIAEAELEMNPLGALLFYIARDSEGKKYLITSLPGEGFSGLNSDESIHSNGKLIDGSVSLEFKDFKDAFYVFCEIIVEKIYELGITPGSSDVVNIEFDCLLGSRYGFYDGQAGVSLEERRQDAFRNIVVNSGFGQKDVTDAEGMIDLTNFVDDEEYITYINEQVVALKNGEVFTEPGKVFDIEGEGKTYKLTVNLEANEENTQIKVTMNCEEVDSDGNSLSSLVELEGTTYDVAQWQRVFDTNLDIEEGLRLNMEMTEALTQQLKVAFQARSITFKGEAGNFEINLALGDRGIKDVHGNIKNYGYVDAEVSKIVIGNGMWQDSIADAEEDSGDDSDAEEDSGDDSAGEEDSGDDSDDEDTPSLLKVDTGNEVVDQHLRGMEELVFAHGYVGTYNVADIGTGINRLSIGKSVRGDISFTYFDSSGESTSTYRVEDGYVQWIANKVELDNGYFYTYEFDINKDEIKEYIISDKQGNNLFTLDLRDKEGSAADDIELDEAMVNEIVSIITAKLRGVEGAQASPVIYLAEDDNTSKVVIVSEEEGYDYKISINIGSIPAEVFARAAIEAQNKGLEAAGEIINNYIKALLGDVAALFFVLPGGDGEYLLTSLPEGGYEAIDSDNKYLVLEDGTTIENPNYYTNYGVKMYEETEGSKSLAASSDDFAAAQGVFCQVLVLNVSASGMQMSTTNGGVNIQFNSMNFEQDSEKIGYSTLSEEALYQQVIEQIGIKDQLVYRPWGVIPINLPRVNGSLDEIISEQLQEDPVVMRDFMLFLTEIFTGERDFNFVDPNMDEGFDWADGPMPLNGDTEEFIISPGVEGGKQYKLQVKLGLFTINVGLGQPPQDFIQIYTRCVEIDEEGNELNREKEQGYEGTYEYLGVDGNMHEFALLTSYFAVASVIDPNAWSDAFTIDSSGEVTLTYSDPEWQGSDDTVQYLQSVELEPIDKSLNSIQSQSVSLVGVSNTQSLPAIGKVSDVLGEIKVDDELNSEVSVPDLFSIFTPKSNEGRRSGGSLSGNDSN